MRWDLACHGIGILHPSSDHGQLSYRSLLIGIVQLGESELRSDRLWRREEDVGQRLAAAEFAL